jgi:tetratricopeptide (TPR) repeat protein
VKESRDQAVMMLTLDPLAPASHDHLGWFEFEISQFDSARTADRKAIELDPGYVAAYDQLADIERVTRHWAAFRQVIQKGAGPIDPLLWPLVDAAEAGRHDEAHRILDRIASPSDTSPWSETTLAWWFLEAGDRDRAFAELDSAYVHHDYFVKYVNLDPGLASLRSDPRYADLRRRMRLPQ